MPEIELHFSNGLTSGNEPGGPGEAALVGACAGLGLVGLGDIWRWRLDDVLEYAEVGGGGKMYHTWRFSNELPLGNGGDVSYEFVVHEGAGGSSGSEVGVEISAESTASSHGGTVLEKMTCFRNQDVQVIRDNLRSAAKKEVSDVWRQGTGSDAWANTPAVLLGARLLVVAEDMRNVDTAEGAEHGARCYLGTGPIWDEESASYRVVKECVDADSRSGNRAEYTYYGARRGSAAREVSKWRMAADTQGWVQESGPKSECTWYTGGTQESHEREMESCSGVPGYNPRGERSAVGQECHEGSVRAGREEFVDGAGVYKWDERTGKVNWGPCDIIDRHCWMSDGAGGISNATVPWSRGGRGNVK